jgi:hypothetical protein
MTDARTLLEQHDLGCQCWPHVSRKDALAAEADAAALRERVAAIRQTYLGYSEQMDKGVHAVCDAILASLTPTPATDEARCGCGHAWDDHAGAVGMEDGEEVCLRLNPRPTPTEPAP